MHEIAHKSSNSPGGPQFDFVRNRPQEAHHKTPLEEQAKTTRDQLAELTQAKTSILTRISLIDNERTSIQKQAPEIRNRAWAIKRLISKQTRGNFKDASRFQQKYEEVKEEVPYAQSKFFEIPGRLQQLQQEKTALLEKQEQLDLQLNSAQARSEELNTLLDKQHLPSEPGGEVTETHIQEKQVQVHTLKKQLYDTIKEHDTLLPALSPEDYKELEGMRALYQDPAGKEAIALELSKSQKKDLDDCKAEVEKDAKTFIEISSSAIDDTKKRPELVTKARELSTQLATSQYELEQMESKVATPPENRRQVALEGDSYTQISVHVWDAQINHYRGRQCLKTVKGEFKELEQRMNSSQEQLASLPDIKQGNSLSDQYRQWVFREEHLYAREDELSSIKKSYDRSNLNIKKHEKICQQSLHDIQATIKEIETRSNAGDDHPNPTAMTEEQEVETRSNAGNDHPNPPAMTEEQEIETRSNAGDDHPGLSATKEELTELQKKIQKTIKALTKESERCDEKCLDARQQLDTLKENDLPEVQARRKELKTRLFQDHPYFSWYERSEYDSEAEGHHSLSNGEVNGCVPSCALTRMSDYQNNAHFDKANLSSKKVNDTMKFDRFGNFYLDQIPDTFEKLDVPERHSFIELQTGDRQTQKGRLENLLQDGPAIVIIQSEEVGTHGVIVDKIKRDPITNIEYVCIRDSIESQPEEGVTQYRKGKSYKVRARTFEDSWDAKYLVVPTKSLTRLQENEYIEHQV